MSQHSKGATQNLLSPIKKKNPGDYCLQEEPYTGRTLDELQDFELGTSPTTKSIASWKENPDLDAPPGKMGSRIPDSVGVL
jgi:hypothetical protein